MGAHTRPRSAQTIGRHRGQPAPLIDIDLSGTAARAGAVLATGATAATVVVAGAGGAVAAPSLSGPAALAALRGCESGGNYSINTGNGFYGAYQFDLQTWHGLGYPGLPSQASPATQDQAVERLQAARGWEPWPACSRRLGLTGSFAGLVGTVTRTYVRTAAPRAATVHFTGAVPAFAGTTLNKTLVAQKREDVRVWQARMQQRGWRIAVDGRFGPQSAHVAASFAAEKHVAAPAGQVTATVWKAAWTAPITH